MKAKQRATHFRKKRGQAFFCSSLAHIPHWAPRSAPQVGLFVAVAPQMASPVAFTFPCSWFPFLVRFHLRALFHCLFSQSCSLSTCGRYRCSHCLAVLCCADRAQEGISWGQKFRQSVAGSLLMNSQAKIQVSVSSCIPT